jgi:hypothetical protein
LELSVVATLELTRDAEASAKKIAADRGWSASAREVLDMPTMLIGSTHELVDLVRTRRERFGVSYFVVRDSQFADAAALVQQLRGT